MMKSANKQDEEEFGHFFLDGKPVHRLSYCAFLDVLGFSERTLASYKDGSAEMLLETFYGILAKSIAQIKESVDDEFSMLYFKSFTDNLVLAHPQLSKDLESEFAFILYELSVYQFQMALEGFFIRGGLAVGQLFMDKNCVYGEALLEAHDLETEVAINPVIVLSDKVMKLVDKHITYCYAETAPQLRDVLKSSDGRYFLNYLMECIVDGYDRTYLNTESLCRHKKQIESALEAHAAVPRVFSKFVWLASYHNYFCDMVSSYPEYKNSLKVSRILASIQFQRLAKKK